MAAELDDNDVSSLLYVSLFKDNYCPFKKTFEIVDFPNTQVYIYKFDFP